MSITGKNHAVASPERRFTKGKSAFWSLLKQLIAQEKVFAVRVPGVVAEAFSSAVPLNPVLSTSPCSFIEALCFPIILHASLSHIISTDPSGSKVLPGQKALRSSLLVAYGLTFRLKLMLKPLAS